jgi:hypothetical protein
MPCGAGNGYHEAGPRYYDQIGVLSLGCACPREWQRAAYPGSNYFDGKDSERRKVTETVRIGVELPEVVLATWVHRWLGN